MRTFTCACGNRLYFQNSVCGQCGRLLGFLPDRLRIAALEPAGNEQSEDPSGELFRALSSAALSSSTLPSPEPSNDSLYRQCANYRFEQVCNWLIEPGDDATFCRACRLNHLIPDLSVAENRARWARIEDAKRRALYTLYRLHLPVIGRAEDPERGLSFDFLADPAAGEKVYTGHDNGLITINLAEADSGRREEMREHMGERYRTLLGHFRHEMGHYYWDKLIDGSDWLPRFRERFGDERADYRKSLQHHYDNGAPPDWPVHFVSAYASVHPWEDWAESWAHYLHITDTLETASEFELSLGGKLIGVPPLLREPLPSEKAMRTAFDGQIADWGNMAVAMNAVNRSMGMPDPYPFVLADAVIEKLRFVHEVIARHEASQPTPLE